MIIILNINKQLLDEIQRIIWSYIHSNDLVNKNINNNSYGTTVNNFFLQIIVKMW